MKLLSRSEEIILLAILKLEGNAYGISIRDHIKGQTGMEWSFASIYDPLNKLVQKGFAVKYRGAPTPERGGRHKCLYRITPEGKEALMDIRRVQDTLWKDLSPKALE